MDEEAAASSELSHVHQINFGKTKKGLSINDDHYHVLPSVNFADDTWVAF